MHGLKGRTRKEQQRSEPGIGAARARFKKEQQCAAAPQPGRKKGSKEGTSQDSVPVVDDNVPCDGLDHSVVREAVPVNVPAGLRAQHQGGDLRAQPRAENSAVVSTQQQRSNAERPAEPACRFWFRAGR